MSASKDLITAGDQLSDQEVLGKHKALSHTLSLKSILGKIMIMTPKLKTELHYGPDVHSKKRAGLCWTLLDIARLCWTLLDFTGLCWSLLDYVGLFQTMSDSVGLCWTLLDSFGLYWTLLVSVGLC